MQHPLQARKNEISDEVGLIDMKLGVRYNRMQQKTKYFWGENMSTWGDSKNDPKRCTTLFFFKLKLLQNLKKNKKSTQIEHLQKRKKNTKKKQTHRFKDKFELTKFEKQKFFF